MKKIATISSFAALLSACGATTAGVPLTIQQVDQQKYIADVSVSRSGNGADSSYVRELHRQQISLSFINENLCNRGLLIERPIAIGDNADSYLLQYPVTCKAS